MTPQPFMPLYVGEILAATLTWEGEERALLLLLLACSWASGPLPTDTARLAKVAVYEFDKFAALWKTVAQQFHKVEGGLINPRIEELRAHAQRLQTQRIGASHKGVERKRQLAEAEEQQRNLPLGKPSGEPDGKPPGQPSDEPLDTPLGEPNGQPFRSGKGREDQGRIQEGDSFGISRPPKRTVSREFHNQVIALYHEVLPDLPSIKVWSKKRQSYLVARIRERIADGKPADTGEYWRSFFESVAASDFLCGRKTDFRCDLEWLLRPENFTKTIEGRYENRGRAANGGGVHVR